MEPLQNCWSIKLQKSSKINTPRKILLVEPNYKNKYPPIGLMKISTYFKSLGDDVRFFKGEIKDLKAELLTEKLIHYLTIINADIKWSALYLEILNYIRYGRKDMLHSKIFNDQDIYDVVNVYRQKYKNDWLSKNPIFDWIGITTLFTFYWEKTIATINEVKGMCKNQDNIMVGGVMASILPNEIYEATGIKPHVGLLNKKGDIDKNNKQIIDLLPLDYSIIDEVDYSYPVTNSYFAYTTRGCINNCSFCAVPKLEPKYKNYIDISNIINETDQKFGKKQNLLLLDNNVLASKQFNKIINQIKNFGFAKNSTFVPDNEYEIAIRNLNSGYNDKAYKKKIISIYKDIVNKIDDPKKKSEIYTLLKENDCLYWNTASTSTINKLNSTMLKLYNETHSFNKKQRTVDFNQGIDARLINEKNIKKLAEINISPLRIAFDRWSLRKTYEKAVRLSVSAGITRLSNYMLYNYQDKPEDLYNRLKLNVNLSDELNANIFSFPMKYHPISDPKYFMNRNYIGKNWNKKFIRAVQAILNATKGKVGKGLDFFEEAFGKNIEDYYRILWMPEPFIIYRRMFDENLRNKLKDKYVHETQIDCNFANEWWDKFCNLNEKQKIEAKKIIAQNDFNNPFALTKDKTILDILKYYVIKRDDIIVELK